jgi:hypothetical protein
MFTPNRKIKMSVIAMTAIHTSCQVKAIESLLSRFASSGDTRRLHQKIGAERISHVFRNA